MASSKRTSPEGAQRDALWLGSDERGRARPWAYEALLFDSDSPAETDALSSLAADVASDLAELKHLQADLFDQVVRLAVLQGRLLAGRASSEATAPPVEDGPVARPPELRSFPSDHRRSPAASARARDLARCEGGRVESPEGFVGLVDGLRFVSRIDEPDLIEVRGGRFGRELALIPIEAIEEISLEHERIVVRSAPKLHDVQLRELVERLRGALHSLL